VLKRGVLFFILFIISGCALRNKQVAGHNKDQSDAAGVWRSELERIEAKLADVPLPLKTLLEPQQVSFSAVDATATMRIYQARLTADELVLFYQQEMERMGWKQLLFFVGQESLLVFERPTRSCVISIRPGKQSTELMIVIGAKMAD
jgi:hypothetical protein